MRRKEMANQYAEEKRCFFSFDLKEESEDEGRKRVPDHRSDVLKGFLPQGPPRPRNTVYLSIRRLSEESETESRDEATRRGTEELYERQCGSRLELFCIETGC